MYAAHLEAMRRIVTGAGLDAIALVPGPNMVYLTGQEFHLSERPLLGLYPPAGDPVFILPALEQDKLASPPYPIRLFPYTDTDGPDGAFRAALEAGGISGGRLGVEGLRMRYNEAQLIARHAPGVVISDAGDALAALRLRKDAAEVAALRRAIAISQDALQEVIGAVRPGMTERQIANALVIAMLQRGGGELLFPPIVLGGPNSALPHGVPGDRALREGDLLLFDFGISYDHYTADITRTFALGEPDARLREAYAAVYAANAAGRRAAGPGVPCQEVDRAARAEIEKAGLGPYFTHRTGHGLGMEVHEGPYIREGNAGLLEVGHVFTVEPGVYLPGVGGVRIEDNVLITADGAESLTTFPRELQMIGG